MGLEGSTRIIRRLHGSTSIRWLDIHAYTAPPFHRQASYRELPGILITILASQCLRIIIVSPQNLSLNPSYFYRDQYVEMQRAHSLKPHLPTTKSKNTSQPPRIITRRNYNTPQSTVQRRLPNLRRLPRRPSTKRPRYGSNGTRKAAS